jgi:hypothetical protein
MLNYSGNETLSLFNLPNGGGSSFAEAQDAGNGGAVEDATITATIVDGNFDPIAGFPAEDLWLASVDGGMVPCVGGTSADADTDANGVTTWANPLNAGGSSEALCEIMVSGDALTSASLALRFNSADLNSDGTVGLTDVGLFSTIFYGAYDFSADFFADGSMGLSDVGRLALGLGGSCP